MHARLSAMELLLRSKANPAGTPRGLHLDDYLHIHQNSHSDIERLVNAVKHLHHLNTRLLEPIGLQILQTAASVHLDEAI